MKNILLNKELLHAIPLLSIRTPPSTCSMQLVHVRAHVHSAVLDEAHKTPHADTPRAADPQRAPLALARSTR